MVRAADPQGRGPVSVEWLDIVDEDDRVVGRDTRENVHANHERHRGVHVIVVDSQGRVLVQRRSQAKSYCPGYLDMSAGGQVPSGMDYRQAAEQELREELGCHDHGPLTLVGSYNAYSVRQREKRYVYLHCCDGPFTLDAEEVEWVRFVSLVELRQLLEVERFTEGFRRSLELYLASDVHGH